MAVAEVFAVLMLFALWLIVFLAITGSFAFMAWILARAFQQSQGAEWRPLLKRFAARTEMGGSGLTLDGIYENQPQKVFARDGMIHGEIPLTPSVFVGMEVGLRGPAFPRAGKAQWATGDQHFDEIFCLHADDEQLAERFFNVGLRRALLHAQEHNLRMLVLDECIRWRVLVDKYEDEKLMEAFEAMQEVARAVRESQAALDTFANAGPNRAFDWEDSPMALGGDAVLPDTNGATESGATASDAPESDEEPRENFRVPREDTRGTAPEETPEVASVDAGMSAVVSS